MLRLRPSASLAGWGGWSRLGSPQAPWNPHIPLLLGADGEGMLAEGKAALVGVGLEASAMGLGQGSP